MLDKDIKKNLIKLICSLDSVDKDKYLDEALDEKLSLTTINVLLDRHGDIPFGANLWAWLLDEQIEKAIQQGRSDNDKNLHNAGLLNEKLDEMVGRMDDELYDHADRFEITINIDGETYPFYWSASVVNALQDSCRLVISDY